MQETLRNLDAYVGEARTELTKWQQHIADLEDIAAELRKDADHCLARHLLHDVYLREAEVLKLQAARSSAGISIKSKAHSFFAQQVLSSLRAEAASRQIQKGLAGFLARRSLLVARRRAALETQLHSAVSRGWAPIVKRLLEKGACPDSKSPLGITPLHNACEAGHVDVVQQLCLSGALKDLADNDGSTPLSCASSAGPHLPAIRPKTGQ